MELYLTLFYPNSDETEIIGIFDKRTLAESAGNSHSMNRSKDDRRLLWIDFPGEDGRTIISAGAEFGGYVILPYQLNQVVHDATH